MTTTDELLLTPELRAWLTSTARSLWKDNSCVSADDLAQEGWVAMWKVRNNIDNGKGDGMAYLHQCARRRMIDVLRNARYYVKAGRNAVNQEIPISTIDDGDSEVDGSIKVWDALAIGDNIDALVLAYHEGEIWRAINELYPTQRDYVIARFYQGMSDIEARNAVGKPNSQGLWSKARANLKSKLAHLAAV